MFARPVMVMTAIASIGYFASRAMPLVPDGAVDITTHGAPSLVYDRIVDERSLSMMLDGQQAELVGNWGSRKRLRTMVPERRIDPDLLPRTEGDLNITVDLERAKSIQIRGELSKSRRSFVISATLVPADDATMTRVVSSLTAYDATGAEVEPDAQLKSLGEKIGRTMVGISEDALLREQRQARQRG